jgi:hypothetical protein
MNAKNMTSTAEVRDKRGASPRLRFAFCLMALSLVLAGMVATPSFADDAAGADVSTADQASNTAAHEPIADVPVEKALQDCYVTRQNRCNAAIDLYERKWTEQFIQRSYEWHLFSTRLIFFLVIAIVVFGLYITYLQFNRDYHDWTPAHRPITLPAADKTTPDAEVLPSRPVSSIKVGAGGLELSSQVIGLIVLALSFGFFYLYVKEVYPMVEAVSHAGLSTAKSTMK